MNQRKYLDADSDLVLQSYRPTVVSPSMGTQLSKAVVGCSTVSYLDVT